MEEKIVGHIGVDAGLCWIGDPCYVLGDDASNRFKDWGKFVEKIGNKDYHSFDYGGAANSEGLGVCVSTGYGDGFYPVKATFNEEGRVASVTVTFIEGHDQKELIESLATVVSELTDKNTLLS